MVLTKPVTRIDNYTSANFLGFLITSFSSISLAVFLTTTQTYFITDVLGIGDKVGSYVGTMTFCDEALSLCLLPFVGVMADRIGTRPIICFGFLISGISLLGFATFVRQSVYPSMLIWRLIFSAGLSSVLGVLTIMVLELNNSSFEIKEFFNFRTVKLSNDTSLADTLQQASEGLEQQDIEQQHTDQLSESEIECEGPTGRHVQLDTLNKISDVNKNKAAGKRVSLLGIFSGLGAIFSVLFLLRLPVWFGKRVPTGEALRDTYYVVGTVSILTSVILYVIAYKDDTKKIFRDDIDELFDELDIPSAEPAPGDDIYSVSEEDLYYRTTGGGLFNKNESYLKSLKKGLQLSIQNPVVLLTYFANLLSRCITIGVSVFIPLYVNLYFSSSGKCSTVDQARCPESYVLTSILTGVVNLTTLLMAPVVGILIDRMNNHAHFLLLANGISFIGFVGYGFSPVPEHNPLLYIFSILVGTAQISFVLISVTMLTNITSQDTYFKNKGSITGVCSFVGGVGVMLLSFFGGHTAVVNTRIPFFLVAIINVMFFLCLFKLRKVQTNEERNFSSVVGKFRESRLGKILFRRSQPSVELN